MTEKVTETVTREKLNGVTETCTRETRHQVTELTETREMKHEIKEEMKDEMEKMRGEMQQIGRGLQAGTARIVAVAMGEARTTADKMATPHASSSELKGSAPAGEDREIRETCWARREEVTEMVTRREKLNGVTETCTRKTGRQGTEMTEYTETREVVERLHGVEGKDGVGDVHTHTQVVRDNEGELAERVEARCEQLVVLPREQGRVCAPLRRVTARWIRSCRTRLRR